MNYGGFQVRRDFYVKTNNVMLRLCLQAYLHFTEENTKMGESNIKTQFFYIVAHVHINISSQPMKYF